MATITYTVTVASGTNAYGTGNKFFINGEVSPVLYLQEGNTYIFDQSDSSNATHTLAFSSNANNDPAANYTTGVTKVFPVNFILTCSSHENERYSCNSNFLFI